MGRCADLDDAELAWAIHTVRSSLCSAGFPEDHALLRESLAELLSERTRRESKPSAVVVAGEVWHVSTCFATVTDD
jgi:hypothetical protein